MSEFFLELFSEEIPAGLQKNLREKILDDFKNLFDEKLIKSKKNFSLSSPNRVVVVFEGLDKLIEIKSEEIKGPKTQAPDNAVEGFIRSKQIYFTYQPKFNEIIHKSRTRFNHEIIYRFFFCQVNHYIV